MFSIESIDCFDTQLKFISYRKIMVEKKCSIYIIEYCICAILKNFRSRKYTEDYSRKFHNTIEFQWNINQTFSHKKNRQ